MQKPVENNIALYERNNYHTQALRARRYLGGAQQRLMYRCVARVAGACLRWYCFVYKNDIKVIDLQQCMKNVKGEQKWVLL